jgi:diguanylate cyclase (GGDEF)-like protein
MKDLAITYTGRILEGSYSNSLQERTIAAIRASQSFDTYCFPVMPYITAWNQEDNTIWYEFVGQQFLDLLETTAENIRQVFRDAIQDQRTFHYSDQSQSTVEEEVITRQQISSKRHNLRKTVQESKEVEAVYQVRLPSGKKIWLKDRGKVENFKCDNITLTFGCLTDVTKEMEQKQFLEKIGYFDDLTDLPKRNIMEKLFEIRAGERSRGYIKEFSVLMIDIDHFKAVNDTHGHQAGDFILKEIASLMMSLKRKEEDIGRYGGEEFYGICRGDIQCGVKFAERIRRNIENRIFSHKGTDISITISVGVASTEDMDQGSISDLLAIADKRLYQAKNQGRNRVIGRYPPMQD